MPGSEQRPDVGFDFGAWTYSVGHGAVIHDSTYFNMKTVVRNDLISTSRPCLGPWVWYLRA